MGGPLEGVRVFEVSQIVAAPYCGLNLVDLGADVVKVEPPGGEGFRHLGAFAPGESKTFQILNRGKRGIVINLQHPAAQALVHRIIPRFDVFIMNARPGVAARLGVDYPTLRALRPDLVYMENTGYGTVGPGAQRSGSDLAAQGYGGLIANEGKLDDDGAPESIVSTAIADYASGLAGAMGICAALYRRALSGKGEFIETSLLMSALSVQNQRVARVPVADAIFLQPTLDAIARARAAGGGYREIVEARTGATRKAFRLYYSGYRVADGAVVLGALTRANQDAMRRVLGIEDDPSARPDFNPLDPALEPALDALRERIRATLRAATMDEWVARFEAAGAPVSRVNFPEELADDPQVEAIGAMIDVEHELAGPTRMVGPIVRMHEHPNGNTRPSPPLGRHTDEVLAECGVAPGEIAQLRAAGAIA
jgi:crotonobetainyl-CoA:carnitine CoA-transferase CaiB-like acyl-CoA transferase